MTEGLKHYKVWFAKSKENVSIDQISGCMGPHCSSVIEAKSLEAAAESYVNSWDSCEPGDDYLALALKEDVVVVMVAEMTLPEEELEAKRVEVQCSWSVSYEASQL